MIYPKDMDRECISLCDALNQISGVHTIESCCGHGDGPFHIWFRCQDVDILRHIAYWLDGCHSGNYNWTLEVTTDCGKQPVKFLIVGHHHRNAIKEAEHIANCIKGDKDIPRKQ